MERVLRSTRFASSIDAREKLVANLLGFLIGVGLPVAAAILYPTYMHRMADPFWEWTRLQELPFVLAELCVILWAMARGFRIGAVLARLDRNTTFALALFMVGLFASTLFVSKVPATSIVISVSVVIHMLFGCAVFHLVDRRCERTPTVIAFWLGLGLMVLSALTAWRFLLPPPADQVLGGAIEWPSALPGFISVRHFGSWTGAIAALFASHILTRRVQGRIDWHDGFFLLAIGMTIWSGTRAAILAIMFACVIQLIAQRRLPSLHTVGRLSILTGAAASFAWLLIPYGDQTFMLFGSAAEYSTVSFAASGRMELWAATFDRWTAAPLLGWGSGSTFWEVFIGWPHTQPHNFLLQFLISWGIVGAVGALWLLARLILQAHRSALASDAQLWPLLTCANSLIAMAGLEGMLHYPRFIMLIVALLVIVIRLGPSGLPRTAEG